MILLTAGLIWLAFIKLEQPSPPTGAKTFLHEFDLLRVFATITVVVYHVVSFSYYYMSPDFYDYITVQIWYSVETFLFITSFFFIYNRNHLKQDFSIQAYYKKIFLRLVVPYILWSVIYQLFVVSFHVLTGEWNYVSLEIQLETILSKIILFKSSAHLWFFEILIFLYLIFPLLRLSILKKHLTAISASLILMQTVYTAISFINGYYLIEQDIIRFISTGQVDFWTGVFLQLFGSLIKYFFLYCGYIGIGFLIAANYPKFSEKILDRVRNYQLALLVILIQLCNFLTWQLGIITEHHPLFILQIMSIIFVVLCIGRSSTYLQSRMLSKIRTLSASSYGIYLLHPLLVMIIFNAMNTVVSILFLYFLVVVLIAVIADALIISHFIKKLPFARVLGY
ncbi:MAG: acyltransferase [Candidatus Hodarchaeales archaeon]|jgi:peptidoglycan/LPS O-acetylase OafA/YrhL